MSPLSLSLDSSLLVRDDQGRYLMATADQILEAAPQVIDQKTQRGASFTSPSEVKDYLKAKLSGYEREVFAVMLMDAKHCLLEYVELFQGTIDQAAVYPREVVKLAMQHSAAAMIISHNHPSGSPESRRARRRDADQAPQGGSGVGGRACSGPHHRGGQRHGIVC